jgi:hypothetical protein
MHEEYRIDGRGNLTGSAPALVDYAVKKSDAVKARVDAVSTALLLLPETIVITETRVSEEAHSGLVPAANR